MTGPVPLASDFQSSGGNNSNTLTSSAATAGVSNGDVIVVKATTWSNGTSMSTPTGGGQTFQAAQIAAPATFAGWSGVWVCTVTGNPGSFSISSSPSASSRHVLSVERWGSAFVDPTPAVFSVTQASAATMSTTLTTTAANSVVSWSMSELNSRDPVGATYTPAGTTVVGIDDGHIGSNSVQYSAHTGPIASAGPTTIGVSIPAGSLNWTASGVEIKANAAAPEVTLGFGMAATSGMTTALGPNQTTLTANFVATASMTDSFNIPTSGPVDLIGTPVANQLLATFAALLNTLPDPPTYIQLRVGQETGPLIGPDTDECCAGLAWVRIADIYPSWDSFPSQDNTWLPCGPLAYAVVLEMGVAFCMPWSDSDGTMDGIEPPSTADWQTAFNTQMQHQTLMRQAAACTWSHTQRRAVGGWSQLPVEGGCTGGKMTVTVSVMNPCSDC